MYKFCVFDMDGTVLNTLDSIAYFGNLALTEAGLSPLPTERYKQLVGDGMKKLILRMITEGGGDVEDKGTLAKMMTVYNSEYEQNPLHLVKVFDGMSELLTRLKTDGVRLAILSNKPDNVTRDIAAEFFPSVFDIVQGQLEGVPTKPDPTALNSILERLGAERENTLYIGDSGVDMQTAKNAGLDSCGVLWGFRSREEIESNGAKTLAADVADLVKAIYGG